MVVTMTTLKREALIDTQATPLMIATTDAIRDPQEDINAGNEGTINMMISMKEEGPEAIRKKNATLGIKIIIAMIATRTEGTMKEMIGTDIMMIVGTETEMREMINTGTIKRRGKMTGESMTANMTNTRRIEKMTEGKETTAANMTSTKRIGIVIKKETATRKMRDTINTEEEMMIISAATKDESNMRRKERTAKNTKEPTNLDQVATRMISLVLLKATPGQSKDDLLIQSHFHIISNISGFF